MSHVAEVLDLPEALAGPVEGSPTKRSIPPASASAKRGIGPASSVSSTRHAHTSPACSATLWVGTLAVAGMRSWPSWGMAVQRPVASYCQP